jgi:allantoin racemase
MNAFAIGASPTLRLALITPVIPTDAIDVEASLVPLRSGAVEIASFFLEAGPACIETEADVEACLPGLLATGERLVADRWQGLVINCMCDPGVQELRARLTVPVFGPAETSMHAIASAGGLFSVLDVVSGGREMVEEQVARFGVNSNYVSHHSIDVPVLELFSDPTATVAALEGAAMAAIADGANTLLLGCTGLAELVKRLRLVLSGRGVYPMVVEPLGMTMQIARILLESRVPPASGALPPR